MRRCIRPKQMWHLCIALCSCTGKLTAPAARSHAIKVSSPNRRTQGASCGTIVPAQQDARHFRAAGHIIHLRLSITHACCNEVTSVALCGALLPQVQILGLLSVLTLPEAELPADVAAGLPNLLAAVVKLLAAFREQQVRGGPPACDAQCSQHEQLAGCEIGRPHDVWCSIHPC